MDSKVAYVTLLCKKGQKEHLANYRPVSLILVLEKVLEQIIWSSVTHLIGDNQGIRLSQHEFMKGKSCFMNFSSFCDKVTGLVFWVFFYLSSF